MNRDAAQDLAAALFAAETDAELAQASEALRALGEDFDVALIAPNDPERVLPEAYRSRDDALVLLTIGGHGFLWQPADKSQADWLFLE